MTSECGLLNLTILGPAAVVETSLIVAEHLEREVCVAREDSASTHDDLVFASDDSLGLK